MLKKESCRLNGRTVINSKRVVLSRIDEFYENPDLDELVIRLLKRKDRVVDRGG